MAFNQLKQWAEDIFIKGPHKYWIEEPNEVGYKAFQQAAAKYKVAEEEGNKADAAKHMAWQNELAKRTLLPQPVAGAVTNTIGAVKELYDAYNTGADNRTAVNSLMDLRNNAFGAFSLPFSEDSAAAAVEAAGRATNSTRRSILSNRPYAE